MTTVTLNRPEVHNALDRELSAELNAAQGLWFEGGPPREPFGRGVAEFVERDSREKRRALALSLWQD